MVLIEIVNSVGVNIPLYTTVFVNCLDVAKVCSLLDARLAAITNDVVAIVLLITSIGVLV